MKHLLVRVFLILAITFNVNADDIKDLEIEGISIGDSLLDHMSITEIKPIKSPNKKLKIVRTYVKENLKQYDFLQVWWFSYDKEFKIVGLSGELDFNNDIEGCKKKQSIIAESLKEMFPNIKNKTSKNFYKPDKNKKSYVYHNKFQFSNKDNFNVQCYSISKNFKKKNNIIDNLKVMIVTKAMDDHYRKAWK